MGWWDTVFFPARFTSCLCAWQILPRWWDGDISGVFAKTGAAKRPTREDRRRNIGNGWEWGESGHSYSGKFVDQKLRDHQQSTKAPWKWVDTVDSPLCLSLECVRFYVCKFWNDLQLFPGLDLFQGCSTCSALFWLGILPLLEFFWVSSSKRAITSCQFSMAWEFSQAYTFGKLFIPILGHFLKFLNPSPSRTISFPETPQEKGF